MVSMNVADSECRFCYLHAKNWWSACLFACVATAVAWVIHLLVIDLLMGAKAPFLLFYFSLASAAWYGGLRGGLLATALGALLGFFHLSIHHLTGIQGAVPGPHEGIETAVSAALFIITGGFISFLFDSLERTQDALYRADRRKNEFLATLAHELRNPLAAISNAAEVLRTAKDEAVRERAVGIIGRQARQMTQLVDDLMDVARITHDKIVLRREPVLLSDAINAAMESVKPLMTQKKHTLLAAVPPQPVWLDGDITRLTQIFTNILNNAAKYTDPGGTIRIDAAMKGGEAKVTISDNGEGITPDMMPRIFDMFTQANGESDRSQKGIGIGLSLVRKLVQLHGGSVSAHSDGLGKGSQFTVRLPTAKGAGISAAPEHKDQPHGSADHRRVLVVDDNGDAAQMLALMLEMMDCDVKTANDGFVAIETAKSFLPEIVLLDICMPGMDGYKVCKALRGISSLKDAVIVAQSGYGQSEDRQRSMEAGFNDHLVKPVSMEALEKMLDSRMQAPHLRVPAAKAP